MIEFFQNLNLQFYDTAVAFVGQVPPGMEFVYLIVTLIFIFFCLYLPFYLISVLAYICSGGRFKIF